MLPVPSPSGTFSVSGKGGPPAAPPGKGGPPAAPAGDVGVGGLLLRSRSVLADGEMVGICEDRDNDGDITYFVYQSINAMGLWNTCSITC